MCEFTAIVKLVSDSNMKLTSCLSSSVYSCKLPSHVVIIICSLFVQFVNITRAQYLVCYTHRQSRVIIFTLLGIIYFSYPFLSYLADVKFTRYRILIFSFCLLLIGEAIGLLLTVTDTTIDAVFDSNALFIIHLDGRLALVLVLIAGIVHIVGMGFFEVCYPVWVRPTTRGTNTTVKWLHPFILVESECWTFNDFLCCADLVLN